MKLHIPVVDRNSKKAKFNRSCSVLTKDWQRRKGTPFLFCSGHQQDPREEEAVVTGAES